MILIVNQMVNNKVDIGRSLAVKTYDPKLFHFSYYDSKERKSKY
jgi:hypothetical protein